MKRTDIQILFLESPVVLFYKIELHEARGIMTLLRDTLAMEICRRKATHFLGRFE